MEVSLTYLLSKETDIFLFEKFDFDLANYFHFHWFQKHKDDPWEELPLEW